MRRNAASVLVGLVVFALAAAGSTFLFDKKPVLGLDLQGGASVVLRPQEKASDSALKQVVRIIRSRVDGLGVAEPEINRQGDAIVVQLPGVKDQTKALELVGKTAELRFRPVLSDLPGDQSVPVAVPDASATSTATTTAAAASSVSPGSSAAASSAGSTVQAATTSLPATGGPGGAAPRPRQSATSAANAGATSTTEAAGSATSTATTQPASIPTVTSVVPNTPAAQDIADQQVILPLKGGARRLVLGPAFLTGAGVSGADAVFQQQGGQWSVALRLKGGAEGIDAFNKMAAICYDGASAECPASGASRGRIAIVLDSVVQSDPQIQVASFRADEISITGNFTKREADDLALVLQYGALPVKLKPESIQTVSATLGKDSLRAGLIAGLAGVGLVLLFMVLYYRSLALVVVGGLVLSAAILWAVICWLGATLTLSGATGIIVSIGVTVDSYVVFFERLKDDIRAGRTLRSSAGRGFASAWRTIVAADLVSILGALVLYLLTVGSVRGFAFFLGVSTLIDLVVAYLFTRPAVRLLSQTRYFSSHDALGVHAGEALAGAVGAGGAS